MEKQFTSVIKLEIHGNLMDAKSIEDYKEQLKAQFYDDFNIELSDSDITEIEEQS